MTEYTNKKICIALSSGGVKGVMQPVLIKALDEAVKDILKGNNEYKGEYKGLRSYVDFFGGVSIGSVNAAAFVMPGCQNGFKYTTDEIIDLYMENAGQLIKKPESFFDKAKDFFGLFGPRFDHEEVKILADKIFGDVTFGDLHNVHPKLLITSLSLNDLSQTIWTNYNEKTLENHVRNIHRTELKDAVLASSSFPAHSVEYTKDDTEPSRYHSECDSAIISATPMTSMLSVITTPASDANDTVKLSDIVMISLGTGKSEYDLSELGNSSIWKYLTNYHHIIGGISDAVEENTILSIKSIIENARGTCKIFNPAITTQQDVKSFDDSLDNIVSFRKIMENYIKDNPTEIYDTAKLIANIIIARQEITPQPEFIPAADDDGHLLHPELCNGHQNFGLTSD